VKDAAGNVEAMKASIDHLPERACREKIAELGQGLSSRRAHRVPYGWNAGREAGDRSRGRQPADRAAAHTLFLCGPVRVLTHPAPVAGLMAGVPSQGPRAGLFEDSPY
jgi:hypothetical protein